LRYGYNAAIRHARYLTGGDMERPALKRLLADIEAGEIDCVVTCKVDRLSRSLLDFARMMETFEKHGVSFVSVSQVFPPPIRPFGRFFAVFCVCSSACLEYFFTLRLLSPQAGVSFGWGYGVPHTSDFS